MTSEMPAAISITAYGRRRELRGLEAGRGTDGMPRTERLRPGVQLMLGLAAHDVAVVERLHGARGDPRVGQRVARRLGEELGRRPVV
jgi:hypothetical protein